jgi:hypothetical protein
MREYPGNKMRDVAEDAERDMKTSRKGMLVFWDGLRMFMWKRRERNHILTNSKYIVTEFQKIRRLRAA